MKTYQIFKKLQSESGAVEFIEASYILPFILILISYLFILTLISLDQVSTNEKIFNKSLETIYIEKKDEASFHINKNEIRLEKNKNIIADSVTSYKDEKKYSDCRRIYFPEFIRKVDLAKSIIEETNKNTNLDTKVNSYINKYKQSYKIIMEKTK